MLSKPILLFSSVFAIVVLGLDNAEGKKRPRPPKVQVLQPTAKQALTGTVDVKVKITTVAKQRHPSSVYVGIGGPPWSQMQT